MTDQALRPEQFQCPACPGGVLLLSVEMEDHSIYSCDGARCGASLWLPTDHRRGLKRDEQLRIARIKLVSRLRQLAADSN